MTDDVPRGWRVWWLAVRPKTLSIAVAPVLVGTAAAWSEAHRFDPLPMAAAVAGAVLIEAGTNLWNDVADTEKGADLPTRTGPARATAMGWATPAAVRRAALACFAAASAAGLYLAAVGGWPIVILGIASLLSGWAYSFGPWPISHSPAGEAFVLAFFGLGAVAGSAWVQQPALSGAILAAGAAVGLPACGVLMVNNYRDAEQDRLAGRRTLAIVLGRGPSKAAYALFMLLPFALLAALPPGAWLGMAALPLALHWIARFLRRPPGPAFNPILAGTARCQLILAVLMAAGMVGLG